MNKSNKKGFTLAELLIVVAIIAVLVAIAIPVFTSQLEKSKDAVSVANLRAAYAEATANYLTSSDNGSGAHTEKIKVTFKGNKNTDNYSGLASELPFTAPAEPAAGEHEVTFSWADDGTLTVTAA